VEGKAYFTVAGVLKISRGGGGTLKTRKPFKCLNGYEHVTVGPTPITSPSRSVSTVTLFNLRCSGKSINSTVNSMTHFVISAINKLLLFHLRPFLSAVQVATAVFSSFPSLVR
jgi:hypothetical protein